MEAIKIALLGIVVVLLAIVVRQKEPVFGTLLSLTGCFLVFGAIISRVSAVVILLEDLMELLGEQRAYLLLLLKAVGITMLTEFSAGICKENGLVAMGDLVRIFGKISVLLLGIPIMASLLEVILSFSL